MQRHEHLSYHGIIRNVFQPFSIILSSFYFFRWRTVQAKSCLAFELCEMYSTSVFQYLCVCVCRLVLWDMQDEKRLSQYLRSLNIAVPRFRPSLSLHTHHEFMKWVDTLISQYISLLFYLLSQWVINAKPHWGFVARWDRRLARWPILSNSGRRLQLVAQRQT